MQTIALFILLGTALARRGRWGNPCRETVEGNQQDSDLQALLVPFTGSAEEGVTLSDSTKCVMRGLSRNWPHEDAESPAERRLLRRRRRSKVAFDVSPSAIGPLNQKRRGEYTCYSEGEVTFSFKSAEMTLSDNSEVSYNAEIPPRRILHRGGHSSSDSSEDEPQLPFAILTLTQTNSFGEEGEEIEPVSFDLSVECRAMYDYDDSDETCTLKGLSCRDGEYSYLVTEEDESTQGTEERFFGGLRCISGDDDFLADWDACPSADQ